MFSSFYCIFWHFQGFQRITKKNPWNVFLVVFSVPLVIGPLHYFQHIRAKWMGKNPVESIYCFELTTIPITLCNFNALLANEPLSVLFRAKLIFACILIRTIDSLVQIRISSRISADGFLQAENFSYLELIIKTAPLLLQVCCGASW